MDNCVANCPPMPVSALSAPVVIELYVPVLFEMIDENCHPPTTASMKRLENLGVLATNEMFTTWRTSESQLE